MGTWTLDVYRRELQSALGNRGRTNPWLDLRINAAYDEVCGAIEFAGLKTSATFVSVDGQAAYDLEADLVGVLAVVDQTNDRRMLKLEFKDYWDKNPDADAEGDPTHWARNGSCVYLWPTPGTDDDSFRVVYLKQPDHLSTGAGVTVIPATWDTAVHLLSVHYGCIALGDEEKGTFWFSRAMAYIMSRKQDAERDAPTRSGGLQVAHSWADLTDQET